MSGTSLVVWLAAVVVAAVALIALAAVGWRRASGSAARPCPVWLIPLLENPYVSALAGAEILIERAGVAGGMKVLDVGCGPGRVTLPLAVAVGQRGRVVALDLQSRMLARLEQRLEERGIDNVDVICAAVGSGELDELGFDRAFLVTVLGEIVAPGRALREIASALKPGGVLSVTEVFPDPHYQGRARVERLVRPVGLRPEETFGGFLAFTMNFRKPDPAEATDSDPSREPGK